MDIPKSVKTIEENTFLGCNTLTAIKQYPDAPVFKRNYANTPNLKENIAKGLGMMRTDNYNMKLKCIPGNSYICLGLSGGGRMN